jgi:undecaprenyl pyrophosphate phosphatase UppP
MGKWIGILLAVIVACLVVGFLVDAIRAIAWAAVVVLAIVLGVQLLMKKRS